MKQFLRSFLTLLMLVVWASGSFAQEKTYSYTFGTATKADFTSLNQTKTLNGKSWSLAVDPNDAHINTDRQPNGQQIGSSNNPVKKATYTTSDIPGTIKKVSIEAGNASNASKTNVSVSVNGVSYGSNDLKANSQDLTTNNFTGNEAGKIEIVFTNTATKGGYRIKSITITYEEGPSKTPTTLDFGFTTKTANINEPFTAIATLKANDADLAGDITYESSNKDCATVEPTTGKVTPLAIGTATITAKYDGDDTYAKAVASYTVKVVDPNAAEVTFDFSKPGDYGQKVPAKGKGIDIEEGESIVSGIVSLTVKKNVNPKSRFWNSNGDITYRIYNGTINTVSVPEGYVITAISVTTTTDDDNFILGENTDNSNWAGSAQSVKIEGKKGSASFKTMTVTYSKVATTTPLTLDETTTAEDAKTLLEANQDKTVNVTINRTLVANKWNTLCLPFDVTAEQIKNILKAEGMVREYADEDVTNQTIIFKKVEGNMIAGVPYLIKPTEDITSLAFEGVTITETEGNCKGNIYSIWGTFGKYDMLTDGTELFLNAAGKFVAPAAATNTMKGFRAYFMVPSGSSAAAININIDGETTGINNIETNATVNGKVYNLNGQYVGNSLNGLKKGIYVVNGKKVIK